MSDGLPSRTELRRRWYLRHVPMPRAESGHFAKGTYLYVRYDGEPRWLRHRWDTEDELIQTAHWLNDEFRRFVVIVGGVALVAFVFFLLGWA